MTFCISIFLLAMVVQGLILIFKKDMGWAEEEMRSRKKGITDLERTPQWEMINTIGGIIIVVAASIMLLIIITQS